MTPSQYNAWLRQRNDAIRRHNQEVDRVNRANRTAAEKYVRDVNREIDRVNQHNKRAVDNYNEQVRRHNQQVQRDNQNARSAVEKYNRAVAAYNAQANRDHQRRINAVRALTSTRYVEVRTSTVELGARFDRIAQSHSAGRLGDLLALSEQEVGNSAATAEALSADEPTDAAADEDTGILEYLAGFSQDLVDRWRGALYSLNPVNPDAARHFCTSVREIFTEILDRWADNRAVIEADPACELTPNRTPTRRSKIRFLLRRKGADTPEMLGFVEQDIEDILQLFHVFNEATHGTAGRHGFAKLASIRRRVEGGIMFLAAVAL